MATTESEAEDCTEVVTKEDAITMTDGTPILSVSLSSGSCRSMRKRRRMPWRYIDGIWQTTWTKTPSGLPRASSTRASWGLESARKA